MSLETEQPAAADLQPDRPLTPAASTTSKETSKEIVEETFKETRMGPPSLYTRELAERILGEVEDGRSLHDVCGDDGIPAYSTVQGWVSRDRDGFAARYARAREIGNTPRGRATIYTPQIAERLLHELECGRPLHEICLDEGMPARSTVGLWLRADHDGFAGRYAAARQIGRPPRGGRETLYSPEIAEYLLDGLAEGRTLTDICSDPDMPDRTTVRLWVRQDRDGFAGRYTQAREFGYHTIFEQIQDIADDGRNDWVARRRKDGSEIQCNRENIARSGSGSMPGAGYCPTPCPG